MNKYINILRSQRKPLKFLLSRLLLRSGLNRLYRVKRQGYRLNFDAAALSSNIWVDPAYRTSEEIFLRGLLTEGDCVIDVGANIGTLSLACADQVGASGKVYSFEPHPETFRYLKNNIALNGFKNIQDFSYALGSKDAQMYISDESDDSQNAIKNNGNGGISVQMKTLDSLIPANQKIKLLKIDVEGYEGEVLSGAKRVCENTEILYLECIEKFLIRAGWDKDRLYKLVHDMGFNIESTDDKMWLCRREKSSP